MIFLTAGNVARFRQFFSFAEKRRKGAERAESVGLSNILDSELKRR